MAKQKNQKNQMLKMQAELSQNAKIWLLRTKRFSSNF